MSKQGWTPGPWRIVGGRMPTDWNIETIEEFPRIVSTIRGSGRAEFAGREKANAILQAAAPEMAEALDAIVQQLTEHDSLSCMEQNILSCARAALHKAKGE